MAILSGVSVRAETHTIRFENKCGKGTPQLIQNGKVLSSGEDFVSNGPFSAAIAYLQTGECLLNGEKCTTLEMTLVDPTAPGSGSSTDISLIAPHAFNVPASFSYFGGCDRQGATCNSADCSTAFFKPDDNQVQVQCETTNVDLLITFCGDATQSTAFSDSGKSSKLSSSVFSHTSAAASTKSAVSHAASSTKVATSAVAAIATSASSSAPASKSSASASSAPKCRAGARRRRSAEEAEVAARASFDAHRRHHARNMEAVRRAASH
ncbi:hypothetical protein K466DRAFT_487475 [Polyporus arcularius HHB13444]|uniref:Glycopeptide n=1 Tax=Polyporus arcularius HHB13444 TaxID=1314778 RepID=A0A5C3PLM9_9APHY|nr:hypothetical protein K466DRAFT_487475 [Polyporus arcularius HHB13444]